jgi:hypothetical protein
VPPDGVGWTAERFGLFTAAPGGGGGPYDEAVAYPLAAD